MRFRLGITAAGLVLTAALGLGADWPSWRGPTGFGVSADAAAPVKWSRTENVRWRVDLPEPGNSTPVVAGNRVFVTQPLSARKQVALIAFDRASGKELWRAAVSNDGAGPTHASNYFGSSSPVTDGEIVAAWFGSAGLVAYSVGGKELWRRDLGSQKHTWGYASSPMIAGNRIFLNFGPGARSFLVALDKATGKTLWQADVPAGTGTAFQNWSTDDMYGSWSTPVMVRANGRDELVVAWPRIVAAFDPETGKQLWHCEGMGDLIYPSPVYGEGTVVAYAGFAGASLAVKPGGSGNVTGSQRLWQLPKSRQFIGSGVISGGHLFVVDTNGIAECVELASGKSVWLERLPGRGGALGVWSSAVLNEGNVYVMNQSGQVFVFKASPKFEVVATNSLEEEANASVVISEGDVFLRTFSGLWRVSGR